MIGKKGCSFLLYYRLWPGSCWSANTPGDTSKKGFRMLETTRMRIGKEDCGKFAFRGRSFWRADVLVDVVEDGRVIGR